MQLAHVVELWCLLSQLQCRLILHDALRHCGSIRVRHGDDVDAPIEIFGSIELSVHLVGVLGRHVVMDDRREQPQFVLHGGMQSCLHTGHDLHGTLHEGECGAHGSLCVDVAYLNVSNRANAASFFNDVSKQRVEYR